VFEAELTTKIIQHLMQDFDFFKNNPRPFVLGRGRDEGISQSSIIFHPDAALGEPFLGKRKLIKIAGDHEYYPDNAFCQALERNKKAQQPLLVGQKNRLLIYFN
jgi:hypothetical protein